MARLLELKGGEELLPLPTAIEKVTGTRPHPCTCSRWAQSGSNGCVLPTVVYGRRRKTTVEAVQRWVEEMTEAANAR